MRQMCDCEVEHISFSNNADSFWGLSGSYEHSANLLTNIPAIEFPPKASLRLGFSFSRSPSSLIQCEDNLERRFLLGPVAGQGLIEWEKLCYH